LLKQGNLHMEGFELPLTRGSIQTLSATTGPMPAWTVRAATFSIKPRSPVTLMGDWNGQTGDRETVITLSELTGGGTLATGAARMDIALKSLSMSNDFSLTGVDVGADVSIRPEAIESSNLQLAGHAVVSTPNTQIGLDLKVGPARFLKPVSGSMDLNGPLVVTIAPFTLPYTSNCEAKDNYTLFAATLKVSLKGSEALTSNVHFHDGQLDVDGSPRDLAFELNIPPSEVPGYGEHVNGCCGNRKTGDDEFQCCDPKEPSCTNYYYKGESKGNQEIVRTKPSCTFHVYLRQQTRHALATAKLIAKGKRPGLALSAVRVTDFPDDHDKWDDDDGVLDHDGCGIERAVFDIIASPIGVLRLIKDGEIQFDNLEDLVDAIAEGMITGALQNFAQEF
jgi:hypothetical protein